jgi:hypothetical protein
MQDSKQLDLSLKTLAATMFLGVAGDLLLRDVPWGIGFAMYAFVILAVGTYLFRNRTLEFGKGVLWVVPPALLFASLFAWRDSNDLKVLNGVCLALLIGVLALRARSGRLGIATLIDYPCRLVERWIRFLADFVELLGLEGNAKGLLQQRGGGRMAAGARGLLIAAPLLLVFGVLFASSDAVFSHFAERAFSFDFGDVCSHVAITVACVWIVGGFLRRVFLVAERPPVCSSEPKPSTVHKIGITEITVVLSTLNALFLSFVAVQFRYLFGGAALVQRTAHLSYADYAHQGFFQLVLVAFLGLAVLVGAHAFVRKENGRDWRSFAALAFTLVTLIFVVMASAATRLQLYVEAYGITRERLYAMAVLLWLVLVFCWFCATTLRRSSERFSAGALATLFVVVFGLNLLNPDGFIAKMNTSGSLARIDGEYLASLSDDAVPQLVSSIPHLPSAARDKVTSTLIARRKELEAEDWRSWNLAEVDAKQALERASVHASKR